MPLDNVHAFQGDAHGIAKRMRRSEQRPVEPNRGERSNAPLLLLPATGHAVILPPR